MRAVYCLASPLRLRTSVEADSGRNGRVSVTIALENPSQTPLARTSTPLSQEIAARAGATYVYQGRWLDFLVAVYSHEACEDPSIV